MTGTCNESGSIEMEDRGLLEKIRNPMKYKALWMTQFSNWTRDWPILAA